MTEFADIRETTAESRLRNERVLKAARLRKRGVNPYPARFKPTSSSAKARKTLESLEACKGCDVHTEEVTIAGRLTAVRNMGKASFADIQDAEGVLQVHIRADRLAGDFTLLDDLDIGDIVGARGPVFRTRRGEPTLEAHSLTMLCKSIRGLPDKWSGLQDVEKRYRQRYLDLISRPRAVELLRLRSAVLSCLRRYLENQGFVEVETPIMVPVSGGASARPFSTYHNALNRTLYLRIATELHLKRLVVGGIDRVFEIGRVFRNEGIDADHNPEFTMLESYQTYADYEDVMNMAEAMVSSIALEVLGSTIVNNNDGVNIDLAPPWPRLDLREQVIERTGIDFTKVRDVPALAKSMENCGIHVEPGLSWARLLDKVISSRVEPHLIQPTFLVDYPIEMSPLAKSKPGTDGVVERFEGFVRGTELCNAFTELNDPVEQRSRFEEQERIRREYGDEEIDRLDEDFLVAVEHGMPPTGGLGMGVDRLVAVLSGERTIREIVLFPQLRQS